MKEKKALLVGASGLVGHHCLNLLLAETCYSQVIVLVRQKLEIKHPKLIQYQINFDELDSQFPDVHCDDLFCCLGTTIKKAGSQQAFRKVDLCYALSVAELGLRHGAQQFLLVSALGACPTSKVFYNRVKGELEQAVTLLGYTTTYFFRPSLLLGERKERRILEALGQHVFVMLSYLFIGPLKQYKAIKGSAVAMAMLNMAQQDVAGNFVYPSNQIQTIADKEEEREKGTRPFTG